MKSTMLAGLLATLIRQHVTVQAQASNLSFDWASIQPYTSLNYTACYGIHKCAKLSVPLDWLSNSTATSTDLVSLAIITRPAVVAESDPAFGGTIIVNPGGPGASGVDFLLSQGEAIQDIADGNKHYEILSFDPRGVAYSEPRADCYNNNFARDITTLELRAMGSPDASVDAMRRQAALWGAFGTLCEQNAKILPFMSTSSVARDMLEIVDKIDELRKQNGTAFNSLGGPRRPQSQSDADVPRIQYWGLSYGTVLGNYFASMFPGRVGRMMLEAVLDIHDYYEGTWSKNLQDSQKVLETLWSTCFEAGPTCALYKPTDNSPSDIRQRVNTFLASLDEAPAQHITGNAIDTITRNDVTAIIFSALYEPLQLFPALAGALDHAIDDANFTALYAGLSIPDPSSEVAGEYTWAQDASAAVACGDAVSQAGLSMAAFMAYYDGLRAMAPDFAAAWAGARLGCRGWRVRPGFRFEGPWTTPGPIPIPSSPSSSSSATDTADASGRPAAPILFLSSALDPVAPRANAVAMAAEHPGARVLVQNSAGHGTLSVPGRCRDGYVRRYFETGEMPPEGAVCEPDCAPFQECALGAVKGRRGLGGGGLRVVRRRRTFLGVW
ncbi:TAP-like protein-domain-containing protein [Hypoxylon sp. NC1633]|nr:TAP-like protein-domain-containing protein [Hypoxylon sp. NC1633]